MKLRVVDAGATTAARSQALWHGVASAMTDGAAPVLSFCRPTEPYVCLGYHSDLDEIDAAACARDGVPVLRRQLGGGPVWIDGDQLFFQITVPWQRAPARVDELYARLLGPAVEAFRALGLDAHLRGVNDIAVGDRKISGTAAGRIGDAVTVVGNLLYRFRHDRMASILAVPSDHARAECLRLMRQRVTSVDDLGLAWIDDAAVKHALTSAYARALGAVPEPSEPTAIEADAIESWEARVADRAWVTGTARPSRPLRQVKICADVFVVAAATGDLTIEAALVDGRFDRVRIAGIDDAHSLETAVRGVELAALPSALGAFGTAGARVLELLSATRRLA